MRIAVAGGTGLIGRLVVAELRGRGHEAVVVARSAGVDVTTGAGLDGALTGCAAVIDVTNVGAAGAKAARTFFGTSTRHLLDAGERAGVRHVVALSIIGIDRVPIGYYAGKRRQEELLAAGPLPWTVLRAAQFHEFAEQTFGRVRGPIVPVPAMLSRPVAAREVAAQLVTLATGDAQGMATEMAGPAERSMSDLVRRLFAARGRRKLVLSVRLPGAAGRAAASGGLLPQGDYVQGVETFEDYLATRAPEVRAR